MAFQPFEIDLYAGREFYRHRVAGLPGISIALRPVNPLDLARILKNPFGKKKAGSQLEVVARSPHRDGYGLVRDADFERFFDCKEILVGSRRLAFDFLYRDGKDAAVHPEPG